MRPATKILLSLLASTVLLSACSSGGSGGDALVTDVRISDRTLRLGDDAIVTVDFSYPADDVFDDGTNVVLVVKLPAGLKFREGTSEIQGIFGDKEIGARTTSCASGDKFYVFDLDRYNLDSAENPDGDADARLTFTIEGQATSETLAVSARADSNSPDYSCDRFIPQQSEGIAVF